MKRANRSTRLDRDAKHEAPPPPAAQTGRNPHDAREDEQKLPENREDLGVGEDHKTEDMGRGKRGTFP